MPSKFVARDPSEWLTFELTEAFGPALARGNHENFVMRDLASEGEVFGRGFVAFGLARRQQLAAQKWRVCVGEKREGLTALDDARAPDPDFMFALAARARKVRHTFAGLACALDSGSAS